MTNGNMPNAFPENNSGVPTAKPKKKIYKRVWFWLLIIPAALILIFIISGIIGGGDSTPKLIDLPEGEYRAQCQSYTYDEVARNPDSYSGKLAKFTGEVVQVIRKSDKELQLRVNVTKKGSDEFAYYTDTVFVIYTKKDSSNILEDDIITLYGELKGEQSYESIFGEKITIPKIYAKFIDVVGKSS